MKHNFQTAVAAFIIISLLLTSALKAQNYDNGNNNQGASAIAVPINGHSNIASDFYGNIFIADADNNRVLMVNTNGVISTLAGTGTPGYWGDGGPAISANLNFPSGVAVDTAGNVYIADTKNNRIRVVNLQGVITTIAGNGSQGFGGEGGQALYATLNEPTSVAVDGERNVYISDNHNNRVRMVNASSGLIYTIAGNGAAMAPVGQQPVYSPAPPPVTYQSYYDELSPYGQWVSTPSYGNVWVPSAGADFVPYSSAGHWVYTSYGWTWVSDYSWGWSTFHYGRWDYDNYLGWFWVPGNQWGPAWVSWRSGNGYYGWAPLPPAYGSVSNRNAYVIPTERYVFVQNQYMTAPDVYHHYEPRERSAAYITNTTIINSTNYDNNSRTTYFAGPPKEEVERYSGSPVKVYTVNSSDKPGQTEDRTNGALTLYRPKIQNQPASAAVKPPAPAHVFAREEIKPVAERPVITRAKQTEETPAPVAAPQPHNEVAPNRTPENAQPNRNVNANTPPSTNSRPVVTQPANQPAKQLQTAQTNTQANDKQVGKDAKGHTIYQDKNGNKYYINGKGGKVNTTKKQQPNKN